MGSLSPALLILPFPGLFRVTCYYRGAYYKAFWADTRVRRRRAAKELLGERSFPLVLQNAPVAHVDRRAFPVHPVV